MSDQHEHHTGPVKTPKQMLWLSIASFVVPVFIIIALVYFVTSSAKPAGSDNASIAGVNADDAERAKAARIQKVGVVDIKDANRVLKNGEEVFKAQCSACHTAGVAGAPKLGDAAAWAPRIAQGYDTLLNSALKGKNAMGPQGGGDFEDLEIGRAVVYMVNASGGNLPEPKAAAAAANGDAPAADAAPAGDAAAATDATATAAATAPAATASAAQ